MHHRLKTSAVRSSHGEVLVHCRRTAAVANLIAHHVFLPSEEKLLLRTACLLHHSGGLLAPPGIERLLADLCEPTHGPPRVVDNVPAEVRAILNAYCLPGSGTPIELRIGAILRIADAFDQSMEAQPIDGQEVDQMIDRLREGVEAGLWPADVWEALVESTRPTAGRLPESWQAPVFPQAAMRMLRMMSDPRVNLSHVVEAASLDPATAGRIMQLANSPLFGSRERLSTLSQAITRLGFATAQKVVTTAALRPLFNSPKLTYLWPHSLEIADLSQQLACRAAVVGSAEAYLAGLVHDVGRMALLAAPLYDSARLHGLVSGGCPPLYAEDLLLRTNHAVLGAEITARWRLPEAMVSAIGRHHRPEDTRSPLAHLLYVAEYLSGSEEDLPSIIRLETALRGIGLSWEEVQHCNVSPLVNWLAAA